MENVLESTLWEMLKLGVLTTDENEKKLVENIKNIVKKEKMIVSPIADNHFLLWPTAAFIISSNISCFSFGIFSNMSISSLNSFLNSVN